MLRIVPQTHMRAYLSASRKHHLDAINSGHTGIATPVEQYFPASDDQMQRLVQSILSYFFSVDPIEVELRGQVEFQAVASKLVTFVLRLPLQA